jgi:hypothetical protein
VLECLPTGAALWLIREPDNPYDEHAIAVWCAPSAVPESQHSTLRALIAGYGMTLEEFLATESLHLGYIPRAEAEVLEPRWTIQWPDIERMPGKLNFTVAAKPSVQWDWPPGDVPPLLDSPS